MGLVDSSASLLAACAGDAVKLFDVAVDSGDPCSLSYSPSPGSQVNCVKWNHTNLVVASAGDDKKITLCHKNGQNMGSIPPGTDFGDDIEDSIISISFSNKSSRYLCSGGTGHIIKIWDLQRKRCIKWLSGHTDTITGVMYNCKDEHLASISMKGDLILHNLASGARATELKDPNGQVLRVLDYSRLSRHVLLTAGDDGSIHLWDTTGRSPKVSWIKQHSAPTTGICFSPSNDKTIATVGLDKKLYTFDSSTKRPTSCLPYEAPFSSLAYSDDGNILAAGTNGGRVVFYDVRGKPQPFTVLRAYNSSEAVVSLCWQRTKPVFVNEKNSTAEMALLGGANEESVLMPDPLPSVSVSTVSSSTVPSFRSYTASLVGTVSTTSNISTAEETPLKSRLWTGTNLSKLQAPRSNYNNLKDDMDVFSPLVDVQPITPSLGNWWDDNDEARKDKTTNDKRSVLFPSSRRFPLPESNSDPHPITDWSSSSALGQDDAPFQLAAAMPEVSKTEVSFSSLASETWGSNALSEKLTNHRQPAPLSRFLPSVSLTTASTLGMQDSSSSNSLSSKNSSINAGVTSLNLQNKMSFGNSSSASSESSSAFNLSSAFITSGSKAAATATAANLDLTGKVSTLPRRYLTYSERISTGPTFNEIVSVVSSPKSKKIGVESREELMNNLLSRQEATTSRAESLPTITGIPPQPIRALSQNTDQQLGASSFSLQLVQRTLEESLGSLQQAIHEDVANLHVELIRQVHMQEMQISGLLTAVLEKLDELTKEVKASRRDQQL